MSKFIKLKKSNCKNCYKCIRTCPVKSIRFSANQAHIVYEQCILCGQCFVVCPQDAKEVISEVEKAKFLLQSNDTVIASIAPSFVANYNSKGINSIKKALKKIGFTDAEETAIGATLVTKEYEKIINEGDKDILISSCCHSVNLLIQKYFHNEIKYLADVISPMHAHAKDIKRRYNNAKVVFIGPCVAKKDEADIYEDSADAVLTFEELTQWLEDEDIELTEEIDKNDNSKTRLYPTAGGIIKTMNNKSDTYNYMVVDGIENCIAALKDIENGKVHKCFIEMSACTGSCIGGPVMEKFHRSPVKDYLSVSNYAGNNDFIVEPMSENNLRKDIDYIDCSLPEPSEERITEILNQMGKYSKADELDCGTCGYNSCREKAIAIYQGKADISMCLPYLKEKAENFSDNIVKNTPNGLVVLNEELEVQQINEAAQHILNIHDKSDVLGESIVRVLDPTIFIEAQENDKKMTRERTYLTDYNKYVEMTVINDTNYHLIICIMQDVTTEEIQRKKKENITNQTIEIADKVVDKQMRIVQEIASLLGETTAETKIALSKLKESITDE